jgi:membrane peptidoglycan carboxypeptidase
MASAYGTLATGGTHYPTTVITKVVDRDGQTIFEAKPKGTQVLKPPVARATTDILKGVITQGTGTRADIGRPAAGKTGTSQLNRDLWFVGYTPQLVAAVWVGYPTEMTVEIGGSRGFGGTVAAPIWASFMKRAMAGLPKRDFPKAGDPKYDVGKFDIPVTAAGKAAAAGVVGQNLGSAGSAVGGKYTVSYVWSSKPKGTVVGQTTRNGRTVLVVSKGPKPKSSGGGSTGGGSGGGTGGGGSVPTSPTP